MKNDLDLILNKLIAYARENLMLDALDETYALNRLAALVGTTPKQKAVDADDEMPDRLIAELKAAAPSVDVSAVFDILMPAPHTVDYYFTDELERNPEKAFEFLYDLYERGGCVNPAKALASDGYVMYTAGIFPGRPIMLYAKSPVPYTPCVSGNKIATVLCEDIMTADVAERMSAFVKKYKKAIAKRMGADVDYLCCDAIALASAKSKETISDGPVKAELLDYPVPALAFSGIAGNAVMREFVRIAKKASDAGLSFVTACADGKDGPCYYIVFANDLPTDGIFKNSNALTACGVFATADLSGLTSVLRAGTALSNDLADFKPIYSEIGGVKLGDKAEKALADTVVKMFKTELAKASSAAASDIKSLFEADA